MKRTALAVSFATFAISGCMGDGDRQTVNKESGSLSSGQVAGDGALSGDLMFAWPAHNEGMIISPAPTSTPVFLQFTQPVTVSEGDLAKEMRLVTDQGDAIRLSNVQRVNDNHGITAVPDRTLDPGTNYTLLFGNANDGNTGAQLPDQGIRFRTAPAGEGPIIEQTEGEGGFQVARFIPVDNEQYPATDLSTMRVQFTEPVRAESLRYGETFELLDGEGDLVPAEILTSGHRLTIDPDEDLVPGETYEFHVTEEITSEFTGTGLTVPDEAPWRFTPMDSTGNASSHSTIALEATMQSGDSNLTGEALNSVNLESILLGPENRTVTTGTTFARMGSIPSFEREGLSVPLSIDRNTLMEGTSLDVEVAGELPAGFSSEDVNVRFLSDATGFLRPNPYAPGSNKLLELYLDLGLSTENPIANASFAQQLLHVKLLGTVNVEDGRMVIEAVGVIEPEVLGIDQASGLISFRLEGFRDSADMPDPASFVDTDAPFVRSWLPCNEQCGDAHDHQDKLRPGDDLTVHFSEPVLPSTVSENSIELTKDDTPKDFRLDLNGSSLSIRPEEPLAHNAHYELALSADEAITDLAGNELPFWSESFELAPTVEPNEAVDQAPLPLTTLPGYPCAKTDMDEGGFEHQGRCAGGAEDDERLPIMDQPEDRPLIVRFSRNMDETTINRDTVTVEHKDEGDWKEVDVLLESEPRSLTIHPLQGWEKDTLYRYTLASREGDDGPAIRSAGEDGLPLQTRILSQEIREQEQRTDGGPDLINYFRGGPPSEKALNPLRNVPAADANADLALQAEEVPAYPEDTSAVRNSGRLDLIAVDSGVVEEANIGCKVDEECATERFFHLTKKLDVEIADSADSENRIPVDVHPTTFYSTGLDVWTYVPIYGMVLGVSRNQLIETGPLIKRMRYAESEGEDHPSAPIPGYIFTDNEGQLSFETTLDLYLDAPYMDPRLPLTGGMNHDLRSYPLEDVTVRGPINFHEDGRMEIRLANVDPIPIETEVKGDLLFDAGFDLLEAELELAIPEGEFILNYVSPNPHQ